MLLELHEHEVPDLDEPLVAAVGGAPVLAEVRALVPEDLRAGPARAGVGHPPVVLFVQALNTFGRYPYLVAPDGLGLVVADVDGDPQSLRVEAQVGGHELPSEGAGLGLEVVAEAEVAQHLEEGQVTAGATHLVKVVVLSSGPDALLDGDGPGPWGRLLTYEVRLERDHAGHREQQRRVVRDQTARGFVVVAVPTKEVDEGAPHPVGGRQGLRVGRGSHGRPSLGTGRGVGGPRRDRSAHRPEGTVATPGAVLVVQGVACPTDLVAPIAGGVGDLSGDPSDAAQHVRTPVGHLPAQVFRRVALHAATDSTPEPRSGCRTDEPASEQPGQAPAHQAAPPRRRPRRNSTAPASTTASPGPAASGPPLSRRTNRPMPAETAAAPMRGGEKAR